VLLALPVILLLLVVEAWIISLVGSRGNLNLRENLVSVAAGLLGAGFAWFAPHPRIVVCVAAGFLALRTFVAMIAAPSLTVVAVGLMNVVIAAILLRSMIKDY
jgi:hypothetical protein